MGNASIKSRRNVDNMPTRFYNFQIPIHTDEDHENETRDDSSGTEQTDPKQLPEVCEAKPLNVVRGKEWIENPHPGSKDNVPDVLADNSKMHENEAEDDKQSVTEQQPEEHRSKAPLKGRKVAGEKRRRSKPLPMSVRFTDTAESGGTSFEYGVRRSTRIRMRPLKYWQGERFLYGCVNSTAQLIGVKYMSDGDKLEVEPFIQSDLPKYKEELELAARH